MKRDMDLIRQLLLKLEDMPNAGNGFHAIDPGEEFVVEDYTPDAVAYHLSLIYEAGLVITGTRGNGQSMSGEFMFRRLSWGGHEFIDAVRDPAMWKKTKEGAAAVGAGTFDLIKDIAVAYAKQKLKETFGIALGDK